MTDKLDNDRLLDNAATCSQYAALVESDSLRECIVLNIIDPLKTQINDLRILMKQGVEAVEACGHSKSCDCCWCKMRKLWAVEAAKSEPSAT